ncbi:D-alanyl-D-alanine carboxypeptidase/D-alanyl-D-alanine-endopeptidase [Nocardioides speluncae]|uniref:D-alanyl-D-alanine carboxypeptidase/D-alanyl-D-alanine endopeptidase n=1 Tax=Nocardioides speluncae TaxID=2670337 RepID=UPI000D68C24D|nr:D-alanyl-D-alanine carboxypeptidase/D-alanyl-D-alanine-endopeptidase [Nocardioides speluncae]
MTDATGSEERRRPSLAARFFGYWLPTLLVLALVGGAFAAHRYELGPRWLGWKGDDAVNACGAPGGKSIASRSSCHPAAVDPPEGLDLPDLVPASPVAEPVLDGGPADPALVREALAPYLGDNDLGKHVAVAVAELGGGTPVFGTADELATPASTMKLVTSAAALAALGPDRTFETSVVAGRSPQQIVLVGGGDPFLASKPLPPEVRDLTYPRRADVRTLAKKVAAKLVKQGRRSVKLAYDDTLFTGPTASPQWQPDYIADAIVSPITALWVDNGEPASGLGRVADPSAYAADVFAQELAAAGVKVVGAPTKQAAPPSAAKLGTVESAPVLQIVERLLDVSDNEAAEVLAHHVGIAEIGEGSFAGGSKGVVAVLQDLGVTLSAKEKVYDGSGLSRKNRLTTATLLAVLRVAASESHPELRSLITGMPVAGFTGSLTDRFDSGAPEGRGLVRAKTGTLSAAGVHGLAGVVTDKDGTLLSFVAIADQVAVADALDARDTIDKMAAALAGCHCTETPTAAETPSETPTGSPSESPTDTP